MFSSPLVVCSTAMPLKNKFSSIYRSAGFESFRCNGVKGVDECGYLCWRHWDAGQGSIRLCRAKPSMWTICRCSTNPHPHHAASAQLHPKPSFWTDSTVSIPVCAAWNKTAHDSNVTDQMPGSGSQHALIAGGLSATTVHIFPNSVFTPTLWINANSAACTFLCAAGGGK